MILTQTLIQVSFTKKLNLDLKQIINLELQNLLIGIKIIMKTRDTIVLGPNSFSFLNFRYDFLYELKKKYNVYVVEI